MKAESFSIERKTKFQGPRKVGLDTGILIDLIDNPTFFSYQALRIFKRNNLFFTHRRCFKEAVDWLIEKRSYSKEKAEKEVNDFLKKNNIKIIEIDKSNKELLKSMVNRCKKQKIEFHPPDSFIIADFKKNTVNKVYSTNNHFLDACRLFGIDAAKFPTFEKELEEKLKQMFKFRRK